LRFDVKTTAAITCLLFLAAVALGDGDIMGEAPKPQREVKACVSVEFGLIWMTENKMEWRR
jgi:hypothetical protein